MRETAATRSLIAKVAADGNQIRAAQCAGAPRRRRSSAAPRLRQLHAIAPGDAAIVPINTNIHSARVIVARAPDGRAISAAASVKVRQLAEQSEARVDLVS